MWSPDMVVPVVYCTRGHQQSGMMLPKAGSCSARQAGNLVTRRVLFPLLAPGKAFFLKLTRMLYGLGAE